MKMRRILGLSAATLLTAGALAACSGDDDASSGNGFAGPSEPATILGACPFTEAELSDWLGVGTEADGCTFTAVGDTPYSVAVVTDAAVEVDAFEEDRSGAEENWANFEEVDGVDGVAYVAWTDDELNTEVGYRDNAGVYRYTLTAITPDLVGSEDAAAMATDLIDLTVEKRP
ncbi:hypothetical protein [Nocardioides sp. YIM 152588]|uniref:hypothetical protein n=1 Tax=Nocardioides sp. YIM 152588 TaxID=3158259 RepID=UPI0032E39D4F